MTTTTAKKKKTTTKKKAKEEEAQQISIPQLQLSVATVEIEGTSPLIVSQFSKKSKRQMLEKQMGKAAMKKAPKDPTQDFLDSLYVVGGDFGTRPIAYEDDNGVVRAQAEGDAFALPSLCFKNAIVGACRHAEGLTMTMARGAFHTLGEWVEIEHDKDPHRREDIVRLAGVNRVADLRYRGCFERWSAKIAIQYNTRSVTLEQLINLVNIAGFSNGVGEWRPERKGNYGMFRVKASA